MILSRELGKRIWGGSTNMENGGGGVSSDYIAGLLTGYAKESWVDEHYISIDFFSRLFQAHGTENGSEIDVMPNDMETTITSVESMFGFWTNLYISALGSNGAAPAGISLGMLTDVTISGTPSAGQVLTFDAVTQKWVNGNAQAGATALANLTDVTLTSLASGQTLLYDATNSRWYNSALKTINGQSLLGTGDISVGGGASGNYLPLTGGTLTGTLAFNNVYSTGYTIAFTKNGVIGDSYGCVGYYTGLGGMTFIDNRNAGVQLRLKDNGDTTLCDIGNSSLPEYITFTKSGNIKLGVLNHAPSTLIDGTPFTAWENNDSRNGFAYFTFGDIKSYLNNHFLHGNFYSIEAGAITWGELSTANGYTTVMHWFTTPPAGTTAYGGYGFAYKGEVAHMQLDGFFYQNEGQYRVYDVSGGTINGSVYATGAVTALSDIRRKDVQDFDIGLTVEKVAEAPTIRFLWKDKKDDGMQVGSIAQFWQSALPEVVRTEDDGNLSLQYGVAALVSAIITARKVVDHERRITELEKENERLKEEISQLRLN